jgi:predicted outer membrane repeat protein
LAALLAVAVVAALTAVAGVPPAAAGGSVLVTTTADTVNGVDAVVSLREAVNEVNTNPTAAQTINIGDDGVYELDLCDGLANSQEDANASGDLDLLDPENITFLGESTIIQTCAKERVIDSLTAPARVTLARVVVTGGDSSASGGGVRVQGDVALSLWAVIRGNDAAGPGGGAWASDDVFVTQSSVRNNTSGGSGGGVHADDGVIIDIAGITGNSALTAGGLSAGDNMSITSSTVSHNAALAAGGAHAENTLAVNTSTVFANRAASGANLSTAGTLSTVSSVVALGSGSDDCVFDTASSGGNNVGDDTSCGTNAAGDQDRVHPMLSALSTPSQFLTQSHRPVPPSPVLDHDNPPCTGDTTDQFLTDRPTGSGCDSGSYEEEVLRTCTQNFPDVPPSSQFFDEVCWLDQMDITGGFADGDFKPAQSVTRQSMAAFLYRLAGAPPYDPSTATFPDVPTDSVFFAEIEWLAEEEITGGFADGNFKPGQAVSRQAMAAFLYRVAGEPAFVDPLTPTFPDVSLDSDFFHEIEWLADEGVTGGFSDGNFRPLQAVTRQAMAAFLLRMAEDVVLAGL